MLAASPTAVQSQRDGTSSTASQHPALLSCVCQAAALLAQKEHPKAKKTHCLHPITKSFYNKLHPA